MKRTQFILSAAFLIAFGSASAIAADTVTTQTVPKVVEEVSPAVRTYSLDLDMTTYDSQTMHVAGQAVTFRAYTDRVYVARPADTTYETMNIYVPEGYFHNQEINGYTAETAPIFLPNTVGGYMPGKAGTPVEEDKRSGGPNAILVALSRGCVVAAPGARGRTSATGKAPACLVDMKAAVRYLRHNAAVLPGNTDRIISNGTSAGGALSALIGATGDSADYAPYLAALGAADERDDIYAASVYCPITDLEHADMAYEWIFHDIHNYYSSSLPAAGPMQGVIHGPDGQLIALGPGPVLPEGTVTDRPADAPAEAKVAQQLSDSQIAAASELKAAYPAYINSLHLKDGQGNSLTLDKNGDGPFRTYIENIYKASAQKALDAGTDLSDVPWLTIRNDRVEAVDLAAYAVAVTRLKGTPAFDAFDLSSGENQEFGTAANDRLHFTKFSQKRSTVPGVPLADKQIIREMNPLHYIGTDKAVPARYWRIRHGAADRDTVLAVPAVLALKLKSAGCHVDFASPWGRGHAGDYDLDELFTWIDAVCR